jgi:hypothetical protein
VCRLPLLPFPEEKLKATEERKEIVEINKVEEELKGKANGNGKVNGK